MMPDEAHRLSDSHSILALIEVRDRILTAIRAFFRMQGYCEVTTPVMVRCPGLDQHVEALSAGKDMFLATSPELHMKRLICHGANLIYQITPAFRAEEAGAHHKSEFLMLEWYHTGIGFLEMMQETEDLIKHVTIACLLSPEGLEFPVPRITVDRLYEDKAGWRPSEQWDEDRYFLDWVNTIEPYLHTIPAAIIYEFPEALSALSQVSPVNNRICERFELFIKGLEICNAYSELTDPLVHRERFEQAARHRKALGRTPYGADEFFLKAVEKGMSMCAGNALGVDRLIMALTGATHIDEVSLFPEDTYN
jgi:elongation factor P--(R)-beta-lysine ligase